MGICQSKDLRTGPVFIHFLTWYKDSWVLLQALPLTLSAIPGKSRHLSAPPFPCLHGSIHCTYLPHLLGVELNFCRAI